MRCIHWGAIFLTSIGLLTTRVQATYNEIEGGYIYTITPWMDYHTNKKLTRYLMEASVGVLSSRVKEFISQGLIPKKFVSIDDIDQMFATEGLLENSIEHLDKWISHKESVRPQESFSKWRPKAVMIFFGGGGGLHLKVGAAVVGKIGFVVMPVEVIETNIQTGEASDPYFDIRIHPVIFGSGSLGAGVGGGVHFRVGVMVILGGPMFDRPDQFWGAGGGVSFSVALGVGVEVKKGIMSNTELSGLVDFVYLSAAVDIGLVAKATAPQFNGIVVLPLGSLIGALGGTQMNSSYDQYISTLEKEVGMRMRNRLLDDGVSLERLAAPSVNGELQSVDGDPQ